MKTNTRRKFIRNTSLTATALALTSITKAKNDSVVLTAIGCAPEKLLTLLGTITSVKSGNWSDPSTWGGKVPVETDTPLIAAGHTINFDVSSTKIAGCNISTGATLKFDPSKSVTLLSNKNLIVEGVLEMKPSSEQNIHTIRFVDINEKTIVGRGHEVISTDIGLWVMKSGKLDLIGKEKKSWLRLAGDATIGSSAITLGATPIGWTAGDNIVVCPTQDIRDIKEFSEIYALFERKTIKSISSASITLDSPLTSDHLKVQPAGSNKLWTAEVLNLTRNVRLEGTETGRSHVFIRSTVPHTIKNVSFQHMGPRRDQNGDGIEDYVPGRYALHFHHAMDGSRGTRVENCVCFDMGSHSYVPHVSHGIYFKDCVAFNVLETAFWWDKADLTHGVTYDGCVVAYADYVSRSVDLHKDPNSTTQTMTSASFIMGMGNDNTCINCVAIAGALCGISYNPHNSGAFVWAANNEGVWTFENNLAHSSRNGIRVWQNTKRNHTIINYDSYNNSTGAFVGAYMNNYTFRNGYHYNSKINVEASSGGTSGQRWENITFDGAGKIDYPLTISGSPIETLSMNPYNSNKVLLCTFKNYTAGSFLGRGGVNRKIVDFIHCDFGGKLPIIDEGALNGWYIRIQPKEGLSKLIEKEGPLESTSGTVKTIDIAAFAPKIWGTGYGLAGDYFALTADLEQSKKVVSRVDSTLAFKEWSGPSEEDPAGFHYLLTDDLYSVRWSGKIMAQYTEEYTFRCNSAGGSRLFINGVQIVDSWGESFSTDDRFAIISTPIKLVAGQLYDIVVEHNNKERYRGFSLNWTCPSLGEYVIVPQRQLYAGDVVQPPVVEKPAENVAPIAKAGEDVVITLPLNKVILDGKTSTDADGSIVTYKWLKVSGPTQFTIDNASAATISVTNLVAGAYVFALEVKDDKGLISKDEVKVTVNPEATVENKGPVAKAGADVTLTLPINTAKLDGTSSTDSDGKIVSYKWTKVSGPSQYTIAASTSAATTANNLVEGTYVFKLQITDDKNLTSTDEIMVTVNPEILNKKPIAIAGDNIKVTLPTNSVALNAIGSSDEDGKIVSYKWTKVSGPSQFTIANTASASTSVNGLVEGSYVFKIEVTDDKGATASDEMSVLVEPIPIEKRAPKVNAGGDVTITSPNNNVKVNGTASFDSGTTLKSYKWTKLSGPSKFKIVNPGSATTVINQLIEGVYTFELEVEDMTGAIGKDDIVVTVLPKKESGQNNENANNTKSPDALSVSVSPNPSPSSFKVNITSNSDKNINVKLFDRWGKEVGSIKNVKPGTTITIPSNLKKGSYFGVIEQGFQKKTITLIKM